MNETARRPVANDLPLEVASGDQLASLLLKCTGSVNVAWTPGVVPGDKKAECEAKARQAEVAAIGWKLVPCLSMQMDACCRALQDLFGPDEDEAADMEYCKCSSRPSIAFALAFVKEISSSWAHRNMLLISLIVHHHYLP